MVKFRHLENNDIHYNLELRTLIPLLKGWKSPGKGRVLVLSMGKDALLFLRQGLILKSLCSQAGLKSMQIFLPQSPKFCDYK